MLLSELNKSISTTDDFVHGVIVDGYDPSVRPGLKTIGIILKEDDGEIDFETMDVALSYINHGVNVILEVPASFKIDSGKIWNIAKSIGADISLLKPSPSDDSDTSMHEYAERLKYYCTKWMNEKNSLKTVYPIVGFFEYMISRDFGERKAIATCPYFITNFVDGFDENDMNFIKSALEEHVYSLFGGKTEFDKFRSSVAFALTSTSAH